MNSDAFSTLGLEPRFDLDRKLLETRHRELSRALHPDRYATAPAGERRRALNEAINVNHAYRQLKNPVLRAEALLARLNPQGETTEEHPQPAADPQFLMDMMEQREALSEARRARDVARVRQLGERMGARDRAIRARLSRLLDAGVLAARLASTPGQGSAVGGTGEVATGRAPNASHPKTGAQPTQESSSPASADTNGEPALVAAAREAQAMVGQLRYLRRFLDEVGAIEDELDE